MSGFVVSGFREVATFVRIISRKSNDMRNMHSCVMSAPGIKDGCHCKAFSFFSPNLCSFLILWLLFA